MIARTVVVLPMPLRPSSVSTSAAPDLERDAEQHRARRHSRRAGRRPRAAAPSGRAPASPSSLAEIGVADLADRRGSPSGGPLASTRPPTSTVIRSAMRNTASMSCSTSSMARSPLEPEQQLDHARRLVVADAGHRLVEQQQARLARRAPSRARAGAARRARARRPGHRRAPREADLGEQRRGAPVEVVIARRVAPEHEAVAEARPERDLDVLGGAEAREQARDLEAAREADADARVGRQARDVAAGEPDAARRSGALRRRAGRSAWSCRRRSARSPHAPRRPPTVRSSWSVATTPPKLLHRRSTSSRGRVIAASRPSMPPAAGRAGPGGRPARPRAAADRARSASARPSRRAPRPARAG